MTIIFHFWFSSFAYFLPLAMYTAYTIAFNVFLINASKEKDRETLHKNLLKIAAIVNIINTGILFFFPVGATTYSATEQERVILNVLIYIIPPLITFIPNIFSYGVVFLIYGYKNRTQIGNYLLYTGIFWLFFTTWASLSLFSPLGRVPYLPFLLNDIFNFPNPSIYMILVQILAVGYGFSSFANIFLLIHAFVNKDQSLKIAGLIFLIGNMTIGLSLIPSYISLWL